MKPLAVYYHVCLTFHQQHGLNILMEQMKALRNSGVLAVADTFMVGVTGSLGDQIAVAGMIPEAETFLNAPETFPSGEVPTLMHMRDWLVDHSDHHVLYHHMKGLSYPPGTGLHDQMSNWRWCMQTHCVERWKECVQYLEQGYEAAGVHYHTPETYPGPGHVPFFAGNFWWARGDFLRTLPRLEPEKHLAGGRYEAEAWLGRGTRWPKAMDMKGCSVWQCNH